MDNYKRIIGKKIRERRLEMGIKTQGDLAKLLDTDQSRVSRWERGQNLPDQKYRKQLLDILASDENLLDIKETRPKPEVTVGEMAPNELIKLISGLSDQETELLLAFRELKDLARNEVIELARELNSRTDSRSASRTK